MALRYECGTAAETGCALVRPDDPGHTIWDYPPPPVASGQRALVIGNPATSAYAVIGTTGELEGFLSKAMERVRAARAAQRPHPGPAVTVDPAALAGWLARHLPGFALAGEYTPEDNIAAMLESLLFELRWHPQVWHTAPDIGPIAVYPTTLAEADLADFGAVLTVEIASLRLATPHLSAGDLSGLRFWDDPGPASVPWPQAAHHAITVAADTINELVARWRHASAAQAVAGTTS